MEDVIDFVAILKYESMHVLKEVDFNPEEKLMLAILNETFRQIILRKSRLWGASPKNFNSISRWIHDRSDHYVFSFSSICTHLGLPEETLRNHLIGLMDYGKIAS